MKLIGLIRDYLFLIKLHSKKVIVRRGCRIHNDCSIEGNIFLDKGTKLFNCIVGRGTYFSRNCRLEKCHIGRFCSFGEGVKVVIGQHPTNLYVSTSPFFYSNRFKKIGLRGPAKSNFEEHKYADANGHYVVIGNDVWVASNVLLMEGITIGDGAIVAAGAVVTKDIDPYTIVGGVPAKIIKKRFSEEEIIRIMSTRWFDLPITIIQENISAFESYASFISLFDSKIISKAKEVAK